MWQPVLSLSQQVFETGGESGRTMSDEESEVEEGQEISMTPPEPETPTPMEEPVQELSVDEVRLSDKISHLL